MSDLLAAAAAALGAPEAIVRRSAEARAKATGASVDEVLAAWAGGATVPSPQPPAPSSTASAPSPQPPAPGPLPTTEPPVAPVLTAPPITASVPAAVAVAAAPAATPILTSPREGIGLLYLATAGVLLLSLVLGFLVPAAAGTGDEVRSSRIAFSDLAIQGRTVYLEQGCGACHTQMVRPLVADAGLGPVTLADTNQVIGYRRLGPDLAAIGARTQDEGDLEDLLSDAGIDHPASGMLSGADLDSLVAYLMESK